MKFRYVTTYQIRGLTHNPNDDDIEIYVKESDNASVKAILSGRPDQYCYDIDRAQSIAYLMLRGMAGQRGTTDEQLEIESGIERSREQRKKELQGSEALVFIAEGEAQVDSNSLIKETNDYVLALNIVNKEAIVSANKDQINAVLASLCLATEHTHIQVKHLRGDVYLVNELGKPVYSIAFSASAEGYASMPTTSEIIKEAQHQLRLLSKRALPKVYGLLTQAISGNNDELRRFMYGWSALEIFIVKVFSEYETLFIQRLLESDSTTQAGRYFNRIRKVMKGKYNISDQFVVVAACIGEESVETDVKEFIRIKKLRDALFHNAAVVEKGLPTFEIVNLLKKYLRLHLKYKGRLTTPSTGRRLCPL